MKHKICITGDFLRDEHIRAIEEAATGCFEVVFCEGMEMQTLAAELADAEILLAHEPDIIRLAPEARWISSFMAGNERVIRGGIIPEGCIFTKGSGTYGITISEHIIGILLVMMRRYPEYSRYIGRHEWKQGLRERSIYRSRITVIGTGDIGKNTAARLRGFGPAVIRGVNRSGRYVEGFDAVFTVDQLGDLLPETDVLILCIPDTPETTGLINAARLLAMPEGSYLVNVGRGSAVVQADLADALNSGHLAGAALDVTVPEPLPADDPLWDADNIIITPHVSGQTTLDYTVDIGVKLFCDNLRRYIAGEPLLGTVDMSRGY